MKNIGPIFIPKKKDTEKGKLTNSIFIEKKNAKTFKNNNVYIVTVVIV